MNFCRLRTGRSVAEMKSAIKQAATQLLTPAAVGLLFTGVLFGCGGGWSLAYGLRSTAWLLFIAAVIVAMITTCVCWPRSAGGRQIIATVEQDDEHRSAATTELLAVAERFIGVSAMPQLLATMVETIPPLLNSVYCATYYLSPDQDAYISGPTFGLESAQQEVRIPAAAVQSCGWETERSPFYVFSSFQLRSLFPTHLLNTYDLQTAIQLPLYGREQLMGFMSLGFAPGSSPPDAAVEAVVLSVANFAALAMENIHLVEGLRRSNEELQLTHAQLHTAQLQLIENEKLAALGRMAAAIAHEVNNPLAVIKSSLQLLERSSRDNDHRQLLAGADREIDRIARIMRSLLDFYRPAGEQQTAVDLNAVITSLLRIAGPQLRRNKITIIADLDPTLRLVGLGSDEARQVLFNLVTNAHDAMPDGGTLTIRTRLQTSDQAQLEVADSGAGISPEHRERMFEPFFSTKGVKGNGLGLAVVYGLVQSAGGSISVSSQPGQGACFTILLPCAAKSA